MALFAKFEVKPVAKAAKVEKVAPSETAVSQFSQLSQAVQSEKLPLPSPTQRTCYCCKGTDFWLSIHGGTVCRRCHPPAPGAEKMP